MRRVIRPVTTLGIIALALLVALGAIENWQIGNTTAAVAGAGWAVTLLALWFLTEMLYEVIDRRKRDEFGDE